MLRHYLTYLIHSWGIDKFRTVTEQYFGQGFQPLHDLPAFTMPTYHGWNEQGDGKLWYGVHVVNGRLRGDAKKALRWGVCTSSIQFTHSLKAPGCCNP